MRPSFVSLQKLQQQKQLEHLKWNEHFQGSTVEQSLEKKIHTRWSFFCRLFCNFDSIRCVAITVLFLKAKVEKKITQCNNVLVIRGKFVKKNSMTVTSSVLWINRIANLIQSFSKNTALKKSCWTSGSSSNGYGDLFSTFLWHVHKRSGWMVPTSKASSQ